MRVSIATSREGRTSRRFSIGCARAKALSKGQAPEPRALLAWGPPEQLWSDVPQQRQRLSAALFGLVATLASLAAFLVLRLWPTQRKAHP